MALDSDPKSATLGRVEITEQALRELLESVHGQKCGQSIMDALLRGEPLLLTTAEGKKVILSDVAETSALLKDWFGWTADAAA